MKSTNDLRVVYHWGEHQYFLFHQWVQELGNFLRVHALVEDHRGFMKRFAPDRLQFMDHLDWDDRANCRVDCLRNDDKELEGIIEYKQESWLIFRDRVS